MGMMGILDGGGGVFTPKALDPTFWLRGDKGVTSTGGAISAWVDQSTNAIAVIQGIAEAKPTYSATGGPNSQPCVTFDGGDTLTATSIAGLSLFGASAGTIAIVMNQTPGGSYQIPCMWYETVNANNMYLYCNGAGNQVKLDYGADSGGSSNWTDATPGTWAYYVFECINSTSHGLWRNGVASTSNPNAVTSSVISAADGTIDIGSFGGAVGFAGSIAEIVWFKTVLGTTDRQALETYFASRYAL